MQKAVARLTDAANSGGQAQLLTEMRNQVQQIVGDGGHLPNDTDYYEATL